MPRAVTLSNPKVHPRETPESLAKPRTFGRDVVELKTDSEPSPSESIVSASLKLSIEQARKFVGQAKRQNLSKECSSNLPSLPSSDVIPSAETYQLSFPSLKATTVATSLPLETNPVSKPAFSRTTSKIPTPLSRKTAKSLPTSSDSVSTSSSLCTAVLKASPSKAHNASNKSSTSQPSYSISRTSETALSPCATVESAASVSSQASSTREQPPLSPSSRLPSASARHSCEETLPPAERRRTVVEVCEKVVVPQGKTPTTPPVTPFITVNRVNADKQNSIPEVRDEQQTGNALKKP